MRVYCLILNFIPLIYKSIYSSVGSFEIRELESSNFVLLFHGSFSYSGSLEFPFLRLFLLLGGMNSLFYFVTALYRKLLKVICLFLCPATLLCLHISSKYSPIPPLLPAPQTLPQCPLHVRVFSQENLLLGLPWGSSA